MASPNSPRSLWRRLSASGQILVKEIGAFGLVELSPLPASVTGLVLGFAAVSCLGLNDVLKCLYFRRLRSSA